MRRSPEQTLPSPSPPLSRLSLLLPSAPWLTVTTPSWTYLGIYRVIPHGERAHLYSWHKGKRFGAGGRGPRGGMQAGTRRLGTVVLARL